MEEILLKSGSFVCIILLGYLLKKVHFFRREDYGLVSQIMMNLTLPAAVICSFVDAKMSKQLLLMVCFGLLSNLVMWAVALISAKNKNPLTKAARMLNYAGYNIGCFAMPFMQSFLGPAGVVATGMFDIGNAIPVLGGTYAVSCQIVDGKSGSVKEIAKRLFSSVSLDVYLLMFVLSLTGLKLPTAVLSVAGVLGNANPFLAMLSIGLVMEFHVDPDEKKELAAGLFWRYLLAAAMGFGAYYLLPLPLELRQVLLLLSFAPISSAAPVWLQKLGGNASLSGTMNSVSILIGIVIMTVLVMAFGIAG